MTRLRIGIVGAGGVATRHATVLGSFDDVDVAAIADLDAARRDELAAAAGATAWPDAAAMLDGLAGELDAVYVCVPPGAHGHAEDAIVAAGLPMFVEKPVAADLATAERIAAAVEAAGLLTATGYHWRHLDTLPAARDVLAGRPVRLAVAAWLDKLPPPAWWARRDGGGGQVIEQATHVLDVLRVLVGEVREVVAVAGRTGHCGPPDDPGVVDDSTAALLRFDGGAVGTLATTCVLAGKSRADVELLADGVALTLTEESLVVGDDVTAATVDPRVAVDRAFVDAVRTGDASLVGASYAEALRTHRVACAIDEAARTGRPVTL